MKKILLIFTILFLIAAIAEAFKVFQLNKTEKVVKWCLYIIMIFSAAFFIKRNDTEVKSE